MPEKPEAPEPKPLLPIEEAPKRRPTEAESTPGGVGAPLGTETYETQPLPALDALLQTNFVDDLPGTRPTIGPHAETHMAHGDDEVHSFDTISVYDFILMRKGHEEDTGRVLQDEITAPSVPTTQVPQDAGYVSRDVPVILLESEASTDPERIQAAFQPTQDSAGPAGFVHLKSDQTLDTQHAEVGVWGFVAAPSGAVGSMGLYTQAASSHNATPHLHNLEFDPWTHALWLPDTSGGGNQFWIHRVRDPVLAQDAATKAYVDALVGGVSDAPFLTLGADGDLSDEYSILEADERELPDDDIHWKWNSASDRKMLIENIGAGSAKIDLKGDLELTGLVDGIALAEQSAAYNGSFVEPMTFVVTSNGTTITGTLDKDPSGGLTEVFSDGYSTMASGATVTLTAGGAAAPKKNYIYVLQSNKGVLVASDSDWPAAEHIKVAEVVVQTAALVNTDGILANRNWNDARIDTDNHGHHLHAWERLRWEHSAYKSGSAVTWTGSGGATLDLAITAGKVYQMHLQSTSAFNTTDPDKVYVVNQPAPDQYTATADIETITVDSDDDPLSNKYYNLVIWHSVSSGSEEEKVFINLPSGSYAKQGDATSDVSGYDNYSIPSGFRGYGFLVQRVTIKHSTGGGGTWTIIQETDLRGSVPTVAVGSGTASITTEFADSQFKLFDEGDPTRELAFQLSGITGTRTLTVPDADGTIALTSGLHVQAHGAGDHTEFGNWKLTYTDGSGDQQELALGAAGTYLRSAGAAAAPTMSAILDGDVPATHSGSAHHAAYTDADAIGAVEGEATLNLAGDVTVASGKWLTLATDDNTGGLRFGAAGDVNLYRFNAAILKTDDSLIVAGGSIFCNNLNEVTADAGVIVDSVQIKDGALVLIEAADHPIAPAATKGQIWVKNTTPNELWFTDDAGTDVQLGVGAGHAEAHVLATTGPHTDTLPWGDLNKTGSSLADLITRAHANLSDAPADAHHPQSHSVASHSDTSATGAELNTLTDGSDADALHKHGGNNLTANASSDLTLTTSYADIAGATVTCDRTGKWLIIGSFFLRELAGSTGLKQLYGQLVVNGVAQTGAAQTIVSDGFEGQSVCRSWILSVTDGHVMKLQAKMNSAGGTYKAMGTDTGITATWIGT